MNGKISSFSIKYHTSRNSVKCELSHDRGLFQRHSPTTLRRVRTSRLFNCKKKLYIIYVISALSAKALCKQLSDTKIYNGETYKRFAYRGGKHLKFTCFNHTLIILIKFQRGLRSVEYNK